MIEIKFGGGGGHDPSGGGGQRGLGDGVALLWLLSLLAEALSDL